MPLLGNVQDLLGWKIMSYLSQSRDVVCGAIGRALETHNLLYHQIAKTIWHWDPHLVTFDVNNDIIHMQWINGDETTNETWVNLNDQFCWDADTESRAHVFILKQTPNNASMVKREMAETTQISFSNNVQFLSTDGILPLSSPRWRVSLFDSWLLLLCPTLRSWLWSFASSLSDQYDVLLVSSSCSSLVVRCFENPFVHTEPIQSGAEQDPAILTCFKLPRPSPSIFHELPTELGRFLSRNLERHYSVSV